MICAIAAVDGNWGIGFNGQLLEDIPEDKAHFKKLTNDNIVIMGRKTWDSLGRKSLPGRMNIIITHGARPEDEQDNDQVLFVNKEDIIPWLKISKIIKSITSWIIGGGTIYEQFLPYCDKVYLTKFFNSHENVDSYFPNLDEMPEWEAANDGPIEESNGVKYQFITYKRICNL